MPCVCLPVLCMSRSAQLKDPRCRVPWSQFCSDPWRAAEELHDRGCIMRSKSYLYFHMADQFHCMRTAHGDWAVDFIGRVDQPNDDWAEVSLTITVAALHAGTTSVAAGFLQQGLQVAVPTHACGQLVCCTAVCQEHYAWLAVLQDPVLAALQVTPGMHCMPRDVILMTY